MKEPIVRTTVIRPLRGALVGFGFIAERGHLPEYRRRAQLPGELEIVAVADICPERREAARRTMPDACVYDDYRALLAGEYQRLDFVDIAAPPYAHAEVAQAALGCGLHVLCEKPLTISQDAAHGLVEQALRAHRVLFPCHNYRHAPVFKTVRGLLDAGAIGTVRMATLQTFRTTHARGAREWRPDWRRERCFSGGGIGMDHGTHTLYLAFDWMGAYPTAVSARSWQLDQLDTEDNFSCALTFPNGIASVHLSWTAGTRRVMYTLHGDRGTITVDDDDVRLLGRSDTTPMNPGANAGVPLAASRWSDASHQDWFGSLLDEFVGAIESGDYVSEQTLDAVRSVEVITAAYTSAQRGSLEVSLCPAGCPRPERPRSGVVPAYPPAAELASH